MPMAPLRVPRGNLCGPTGSVLPIRLGGASPLGMFAGNRRGGPLPSGVDEDQRGHIHPQVSRSSSSSRPSVSCRSFGSCGARPRCAGWLPRRLRSSRSGCCPTLVSTSPNIGFFGLYLWGTGWLLWLGTVAAFAIGASLSVRRSAVALWRVDRWGAWECRQSPCGRSS